MLITSLNKLGFSNNESKIYLELLKTSQLTAGKIAKRADLPRATVYSALDGLIHKGLVSVSLAGRVKYFTAESVSVLKNMIQQEDEKIKQKKQALEELIPQIHQLEQQIDRPEITFYEGKKAVESLLISTASRNKHIYEIGDWRVFGPTQPKFTQARVLKGNQIDLIALDSDIARVETKNDEKFLRRQYLVKDEGLEIPAMLAVGDDHLAIFTWEKDNPIGIKIRNRKIIKTLQSLFYLAIKNLKPEQTKNSP